MPKLIKVNYPINICDCKQKFMKCKYLVKEINT